MKAFYEAKRERENKEIKHKIISDSTLRRTESVGLTADVECIPGGGLGDIANAIVDDPRGDEYDTITILGGVNDILNRDLNEFKSFGHCIEGSLNKIKEIADMNPLKHYNLIPPITDFDGLPSVEAEDRRMVLYTRMEILTKTNPRIKILNIDSGTVTFEDRVHPDESGTIEIIMQLHKKLKSNLVWNQDHITNKRLYNGVHTRYGWGCKCCWAEGEFWGGRCSDCILDSLDFQAPYVKDIGIVVTPRKKKMPSTDSILSQKKGNNIVDNV